MDLEPRDLLTRSVARPGSMGQLQPDVLWPKKRGGYDVAEVTKLLEGYLAEAETKVADLDEVDQNDAARQWCYYRAYADVLVAMARLPSSVTADGEGSASTSADQRDLIRQLRDQALSEFEALLEVSGTEDPPRSDYTTVRSFR